MVFQGPNIVSKIKKELKVLLTNDGVKNFKEIIGVGGVDSGESAYKKFQAGASYVQLYTGMVFQGPNVVVKIKKELKEILIDEGIKNFKEIIGKKLTN